MSVTANTRVGIWAATADGTTATTDAANLILTLHPETPELVLLRLQEGIHSLVWGIPFRALLEWEEIGYVCVGGYCIASNADDTVDMKLEYPGVYVGFSVQQSFFREFNATVMSEMTEDIHG